MAISKEFGRIENDPGDVVDYMADPDTGLMVKLVLRRLTGTVERNLKRKFDQDQLRVKGGVTTVDLEKTRRFTRARAAASLKDTIDYSLVVADDEAAETYSALLGRPVKAGEEVRLDGLWNDGLKEHYLEEHGELVNFVVAWIDKEKDRSQERAEALQGN